MSIHAVRQTRQVNCEEYAAQQGFNRRYTVEVLDDDGWRAPAGIEEWNQALALLDRAPFEAWQGPL